MINDDDTELYCPTCGKTKKYPWCCGQEMSRDGEIFFCEICGKERKVSKCCGSVMQSRKKKSESLL